MDDFGSITVNCQCCQLPQKQRDRDGAVPTICDSCQPHQGQLPDKRLARAETHESMLRERLDACRASEARARRELDRSKEQVASALNSRGRLAVRIVDAADQSGPHKCAALAIARDPQIVRIADRHRNGRDGDDW